MLAWALGLKFIAATLTKSPSDISVFLTTQNSHVLTWFSVIYFIFKSTGLPSDFFPSCLPIAILYAVYMFISANYIINFIFLTSIYHYMKYYKKIYFLSYRIFVDSVVSV